MDTFGDPEVGKFDIKHLVLLSSTSSWSPRPFILFSIVNMAAKNQRENSLDFQIGKDCHHKNMKIPKFNILNQMSLKVSKSQKQFMVSSILPKNEQKNKKKST